jgi:hypothetical protein
MVIKLRRQRRELGEIGVYSALAGKGPSHQVIVKYTELRFREGF